MIDIFIYFSSRRRRSDDDDLGLVLDNKLLLYYNIVCISVHKIMNRQASVQ